MSGKDKSNHQPNISRGESCDINFQNSTKNKNAHVNSLTHLDFHPQPP